MPPNGHGHYRLNSGSDKGLSLGRFHEQSPLLAAQQNGTLAPGPLACRQIGRQQVGTVYGRVLALLPRHQAGFFVMEKLFTICI
jgi:hypothetical protein